MTESEKTATGRGILVIWTALVFCAGVVLGMFL